MSVKKTRHKKPMRGGGTYYQTAIKQKEEEAALGGWVKDGKEKKNVQGGTFTRLNAEPR